MCLDVELGLILRVLSEQAEEDGIEDGGLADSITALDGNDVLAKLKRLAAKTLEISEFDFFDTDFHILDILYTIEFCLLEIGSIRR
jgi:hypothetical protein